MATIFGKALKGIGKGAKAVGKGVVNATKWQAKNIVSAAKYTAKNPGKVLGIAAAAAGTLATAGALAPSLAPALAATKIGSTLFGKMVTKTMSTGTVVREKIANTLKKKDGKTPSKKDIDVVEKGLNEEIKKRKGFKLPVDRTSKSGTEARKKLKNISNELVDRALSVGEEKLRKTLNAERQVLIDDPNIEGIVSKDEIPQETFNQMKDAGEVKENLLGQAASAISGLFGASPVVQQKAADVVEIIQGNSNAPYIAEDAAQGVQYIEAMQNKQASIIPQQVTEWAKKPIIWLGIGLAVVYFLITQNNQNRRRY